MKSRFFLDGFSVIIIADSEHNYALSTQQNNNNRSAVEITKADNLITWSTGDVEPQQLTLTSTSGISNAPSGSFGLYTGSGYLYAASSSANHLKTQQNNNINGAFVITISNGVATMSATGSSNRPLMRSNHSNNPPIFSCYAAESTTGSPLEVYKKTERSNNTPVNLANYIMFEDTTNQCISKLSNAITSLGNLSSSDRTIFATSNDYVISTARTRLEAWARNQGKTINYTNGTLSGENRLVSFINKNSNNAITMLIILSMISVSSIGASLYIRKKRSK